VAPLADEGEIAMLALRWTDADEIGYRLQEAYPQRDPMTVRFTELREMVLSLEHFGDDPDAVSEGILEAIQMAWLEYYQQ